MKSPLTEWFVGRLQIETFQWRQLCCSRLSDYPGYWGQRYGPARSPDFFLLLEVKVVYVTVPHFMNLFLLTDS